MTAIDIDHLKQWLGKERETVDTISPRLAAGLNAVLDADCDPAEGDEAPPGIHWCLSPDIAPMSGLGPDGHPARGGFLPPVPFPRRMWAAGHLQFHGKFLVGDRVTRRSRISDISLKQGRSGPLCFVVVDHDHHTDRGLVLSERHDIVYRELDTGPAPPPAPPVEPKPASRSEQIAATPTLLFRYSAVTANSHRIHYDRPYCLDEEHYPGLVVHGPLQATYLLRMAQQINGGKLPATFSFRGQQPLFDGQNFRICANEEIGQTSLWTENAAGHTTMTASAS